VRSNLSIYIHIPYCEAQCIYCDFNTYVGREGQFAAYVDALCREIGEAPALLVNTLDVDAANPDLQSTIYNLQSRPVSTIFLGGGTPTVLQAEQLVAILNVVRASYAVVADAEISTEANPGTVTEDMLYRLRTTGFNRLSMGAQSLDDTMLLTLGRHHNAREIGAAVQMARAAGFDNLSLDFIFGLPGQTEQHWQRDLEGAIALDVPHLSIYSLIVEQGTPLARFIKQGRMSVPDDDTAGAMYDWTRQRLAEAGYQQYEISNWAKSPAYECEHNKAYWRNADWLAFGPGAHGHLEGRRYHHILAPTAYINRINEGKSTIKQEMLDLRGQAGETMMLGLRMLREGVDVGRFQARFGAPPEHFFAAELDWLAQNALIVRDTARIRLTERAVPVANEVFVKFVLHSFFIIHNLLSRRQHRLRRNAGDATSAVVVLAPEGLAAQEEGAELVIGRGDDLPGVAAFGQWQVGAIVVEVGRPVDADYRRADCGGDV
jgi:oxygen-independent coproporphyrinogen III oxidase